MTDDERRKLLSTEQSLAAEPEPKIPTAIEGLETFTLGGDDDDKADEKPVDAESLFNLPDRTTTRTTRRRRRARSSAGAFAVVYRPRPQPRRGSSRTARAFLEAGQPKLAGAA